MENEINDEKTLTLKSLDKKLGEKIAILDNKINKLERNIEIIKKMSRRV